MAAMVAKAAVLTTSPQEWEAQVRAQEWDVVVSCLQGMSLHWVPSWMQVLSFNGSGTSVLARKVGEDVWGNAIEYLPNGRQPSTVLRVATDHVPDPLARLVTTELVPWLNSLELRPYWVQHHLREVNTVVAAMHRNASLVGQTLVADADENVIAGIFERAAIPRLSAHKCATALVVPHMPARPSLWFAAALGIWSEIDTSGRFADLPSWRASRQFQTADERSSITALDQHDEAHQDAVREYERRRIELEAACEAARVAADDGMRRLLTENDSQLVEAVAWALERLGFDVRDMDDSVARGDAKMEDLRVADPGDPGWSNITEVKGFTRGAKTSVFLDIARFATNYLRQEGDLPTSRWYVVNQFREDPPESRPDLLPGATADVGSFALDGGLVIDTRSIFDLVRMVEDGLLAADDARKSLRSSSGIYSVPSPVPS